MPYMSFTLYLDHLEGQDLALGVLLIGAGLVFIVVGVRAFLPLLVLSFATLGLAMGMALPYQMPVQIACGIIASVILGLASSVFTRLFVNLLAGGWCGMALTVILLGLGVKPQPSLLVGLVGLILTIAMTFIYYQEIAAATLSFEGALLFLSGAAIVLSHSVYLWKPLKVLFVDAPFFAAFAILTGTVTGFYHQLAEIQKKKVGTSS